MQKVLSSAAIETASGVYVDVTNPDPNSILFRDIAHALSRQPRFSGHTTCDEIWTVGQHSLFVLNIVRALGIDMFIEKETALVRDFQQNVPLNVQEQFFNGDVNWFANLWKLCFLHDATEAYLVDLPSPIKQFSSLKEEYSRLEDALADVIYRKFDVRVSGDPVAIAVMKWADLTALRIEADALMMSKGQGWAVFKNMGFDPELRDLMPEVRSTKQVFQDMLKAAHHMGIEIKKTTLAVSRAP